MDNQLQTIISSPVIIGLAICSLLLIGVLALLMRLLQRLRSFSENNGNALQQILPGYFQQQEQILNQGFSDFRKELRETAAENRKENSQVFQNLQDALLNRIIEISNLQNQQLALFKTTLSDLAVNLIKNSNEFKESVTLAFTSANESLNLKQNEFRDKTLETLNRFEESIKNDAKDNRKELSEGLKSFETGFKDNIKLFNDQLNQKFAELHKQQLEHQAQAKTALLEIRESVEKHLKTIRDDNTLQLNEMRRTVDEKLQTTLEKRLGESFKLVSDRLEQVHKGLGEMQTLAVGVGDLKKVLSNVKTRGILGEYQLGNILEQILTPEQYATNVATKQGSQGNVEFAVKLPGKADDKPVWLPIDSKFPLETYQQLLAVYEEADPAKIDLAQKALLKAVESFAKDISGKYIDPPQTTDFAIMFLPIESLYAEVLRHPQMFELLQRKYRITITGPTTLSALLNSLHMGFRTLAVQQRSSEVWKVLAEVKTEFGSFAEQLALVHKHLTTATGSLEKLKDTRTKAMERKLRDVSALQLNDDRPEGYLEDLG